MTAKRVEVTTVPEPPPEAVMSITPTPPAPVDEVTEIIPEPVKVNVEVVIPFIATEPPEPVPHAADDVATRPAFVTDKHFVPFPARSEIKMF